MNYFSHGFRFLDRPWFLAGTATPDWLSAADRKVRLRSRRVLPFADESGSIAAEYAAGVLQHLEDDDWFHSSPAFHQLSNELTREFRKLLGPADEYRPGFLGHIVVELLLDAILIERYPHWLDEYYAVLHEVDALQAQEFVNRMARNPTEQLSRFIDIFREAQFLRDYPEPEGLLMRINGVMGRVHLKTLPPETVNVLKWGWIRVRERADQLMPGIWPG